MTDQLTKGAPHSTLDWNSCPIAHKICVSHFTSIHKNRKILINICIAYVPLDLAVRHSAMRPCSTWVGIARNADVPDSLPRWVSVIVFGDVCPSQWRRSAVTRPYALACDPVNIRMIKFSKYVNSGSMLHAYPKLNDNNY